MRKRRLISETPIDPVFNDCQVCGRELRYEDEAKAGMCEICANEEIDDGDTP